MTLFALLIRNGLRELYRKQFSEIDHPRGDSENAGHFRRKDKADATTKDADPLSSLPPPADVRAGIRDNQFTHAGYHAKIVPSRGSDDWSVLLTHPDGRQTEHDLEDRRGRATRQAAVAGLHGLLKSQLLADRNKKRVSAVTPPVPASAANTDAALSTRNPSSDAAPSSRDSGASPSDPPVQPAAGTLFGDLPDINTGWRPPRYAPGQRPHGVRVLPGGLWTGAATLHKDDLAVDPTRFQYKISGIDSKTGTTKELKGVAKYNPLLGGQLLVWHDPEDGKTYVINGHHRAELAQRSQDWEPDDSGPGWHGEMQAFYIPAKTAQEARAWGALANIAEGRGTATDAAKFMRDTGASADALKSRGISMSGRITQDATDLAGLSDRVFQALGNGRIAENRALAIARHLKNATLQDKLWSLIQQREREDGEDITDSEIAEVARALELAGTTKVKGGAQGGMLFGEGDEWDEPLLWQRAAVTSAIRRGLTTERNVFKAVASDNRVKRISEVGSNKLDVEANRGRAQSATEALYLFDKLANSKGQLSEILNKHAERLFHDPHNRKRIIEDAKNEAIDAIGKAWSDPNRDNANSGAGGGHATEGYSRAAGRRGLATSRRRGMSGCDDRLLTSASPEDVENQVIHYNRNQMVDSNIVETVTETNSKISKIDAGYRPAASAARCERCEHYRSRKCELVGGDIDEYNVCHLWRPGDDAKPQVFGVEQLEHYRRYRTFSALVNAFNRNVERYQLQPPQPTILNRAIAHVTGQPLTTQTHDPRVTDAPLRANSRTAKPTLLNRFLSHVTGQPLHHLGDYAAQPYTADPDFESKHPRNHGKFARKGQGSTSNAASSPSKTPDAAPFALAREPATRPAKPAPMAGRGPEHQTTLWHGMGDLPGQQKLFQGMDLGGAHASHGAAKPAPPQQHLTPQTGGAQHGKTSAPARTDNASSATKGPMDFAVVKASQASQASAVVPPDIKQAAGVAAPHTAPPPGNMYAPDPTPPASGGLAKAARVGVPAHVVPPPPDKIERLPNLTETERYHEDAFAKMFEQNPDGFADRIIGEMQAGRLGDAPNIFATDEAKMMYDPWRGQSTMGPNGKPILTDQTKAFRATMNTALHQTANASMKRAFVRYLDEVVSKQPSEQRHVLVTAGGVAAGKGHALKNIGHMNDLQHSASAVWDSAGEQNSTELDWVADLCRDRGIKMTAVFVNANPQEVWATPHGGVIERANDKGRMVDARAFADSYTHGAKNFQRFVDNNRDNPNVATAIIDNPRGSAPQQLPSIPEHVLSMHPDALYATCLQQLSASPQATPAIKAGGAAGLRIWGPPKIA